MYYGPAIGEAGLARRQVQKPVEKWGKSLCCQSWTWSSSGNIIC